MNEEFTQLLGRMVAAADPDDSVHIDTTLWWHVHEGDRHSKPSIGFRCYTPRYGFFPTFVTAVGAVEDFERRMAAKNTKLNAEAEKLEAQAKELRKQAVACA